MASCTIDRTTVLWEVAAAIDTLPNKSQQSNLAATGGALAGLVFRQASDSARSNSHFGAFVLFLAFWKHSNS